MSSFKVVHVSDNKTYLYNVIHLLQEFWSDVWLLKHELEIRKSRLLDAFLFIGNKIEDLVNVGEEDLVVLSDEPLSEAMTVCKQD